MSNKYTQLCNYPKHSVGKITVKGIHKLRLLMRWIVLPYYAHYCEGHINARHSKHLPPSPPLPSLPSPPLPSLSPPLSFLPLPLSSPLPSPSFPSPPLHSSYNHCQRLHSCQVNEWPSMATIRERGAPVMKRWVVRG